MQPSPGKKSGLDAAGLIVATVCGLTILFAALFFATLPLRRHSSDTRDYVIYWATGQQLTHHKNPYDPNAVAWSERCAGYPPQRSIMRNPPWALVLTLPLGFVSAPAGSISWSLLLLIFLVVCVHMAWKMAGGQRNHLKWLGFCFPLALECAMVGQTSMFVLLGLVLFQRLHRTRPFWAGTALWLCTLKPHLLLPFGVVLLAWIVIHRRWRILGGLAAAMATTCILLEAIDPSAWAQYWYWARASGISREFIPSLSYFLRSDVNSAMPWLTMVPCVVGCMWALAYFWSNRQDWDWAGHGNLLTLVSLLVAPYSWMYDQALLVGALTYGALRTTSRWFAAVLAIAYLLIEIQLFWSVKLQWVLNVWPPVFWLVWYLWAQRRNELTPAPASVPVVV